MASLLTANTNAPTGCCVIHQISNDFDVFSGNQKAIWHKKLITRAAILTDWKAQKLKISFIHIEKTSIESLSRKFIIFTA